MTKAMIDRDQQESADTRFSSFLLFDPVSCGCMISFEHSLLRAFSVIVEASEQEQPSCQVECMDFKVLMRRCDMFKQLSCAN